MKMQTHLLLIILLALTGVTLAQTPGKTDTTKAVVDEKITIKTKVTKADYDDLLAKLKKGDTSINFAKMRLAYTETKDYKPYGGGEDRGEMYKAFNEGDDKKALSVATKMLETNYVEIAAHFIAWKANEQLGDKTAAATHQKIYNGLLAAIKENDGLSEKTAMISIGIAEQYFVMGQMGFTRESKALVQKDGSIFDVHTSTNAAKESRKFYFNIDKVFGRF